MDATETTRYRAVTAKNIDKTPQWNALPPELREAVEVVSCVLPFRTNRYVMDELIDWSNVPDDPIYQLTFPQRDMLEPQHYKAIRSLLERQAGRDEITRKANEIRLQLNPHPAGQMTHNVPEIGGRKLPGLQHKYRETVLFFPGAGQTCHAYCTYCFRWAQFVGLPEIRMEAKESRDLQDYLRAHREVTDVLLTGGDPLIMKTSILRRYLEPLLGPDFAHVQNIRIGSKASAYWPQRFVSDDDADDLLRLFEEIVAKGRHMALMAHYSHPRELATPIAREAARRIRETGAEIRMQAPLIRHVNDSAQAWADMWRTGVGLGMIPYYMFVERDTGPRNYFEVPLIDAYRIFRDAFRQGSGLSRTARGPVMSAFPGKVRVLGTCLVRDERVFVLDMIQARNPEWVRRPFFSRFDPKATWLDELRPALGKSAFFFEKELQEMGAVAAESVA